MENKIFDDIVKNRCAEIIKADPDVSEKTIQIMFLEYGQLLLNEKLTPKK
jgi:uncharacterized protein YneF (UPF0154 family)